MKSCKHKNTFIVYLDIKAYYQKGEREKLWLPVDVLMCKDCDEVFAVSKVDGFPKYIEGEIEQ